MIKKSFPIQKPFFYDTKDGIDHLTKTLAEDSNSLGPKDLTEINKLGKNLKKAALEHHSKSVKKFESVDPKTYLSDPVQRGKVLEISKLEKDLAPPKLENLPILNRKIKPHSRTRNPSGRDYWKEYVSSGGKKLPEVSPEDRNQLSAADTWKAIYSSMTPFEKGTWNAEQRKQKIQKEKEEVPKEYSSESMAKKIVESVIPSSSVSRVEKTNNYYPGATSIEDTISKTPISYSIKPKTFKPGLSQDFTREKIAEAALVKKVLDE